jgi:hypothetical protein
VTEQRIALKALEKARLDKDAAVRPFFAWLERRPYPTWKDVFQVVRADHAASKERIIQALWGSGDPVVRANVLRGLDPGLPDEDAILHKLVSAVTGVKDTPVLRALLRSRDRRLLERIARKRTLPVDLRREVDALLLVPPEA